MHYTGTIWRPPYEDASLLLEVTAGYTHHKCKFCTLYDDLPFSFRMSPLEDVEEDLKEARDLLGRQNRSITRTFLTGANPFVLKTDRLLAIAKLVRRYFPGNRTIGCFSRVTDIALKTDQELDDLRTAGYDSLTIGIETGDGEALDFMRKGYGPDDIIQQCCRLDETGIRYYFFYLTGISGAGRGVTGARQTAAVCNQLHPRLIGTSMLTVYPQSALAEEIQRGTWKEEGELEKYRELRTLVEELTIPVIFAALGASNAVPLWGALPQEKPNLLDKLDQIIETSKESDLRRYRENLPHL